jgi:hypothetical protein
MVILVGQFFTHVKLAHKNPEFALSFEIIFANIEFE